MTITPISKFQYKLEKRCFNELVAQHRGLNKTRFEKEVVARVSALAISILCVLSTTLRIVEGIYLLGKGIIEGLQGKKSAIFTKKFASHYFKSLGLYAAGIPLGFILGVINPLWAAPVLFTIAAQPAITKTDEVIPRTSPEIVNAAYEILYDVDKVLLENDVDYSVEGGILLGAYRNGGFIPWDDDLDIIVHQKDKPRFDEGGDLRQTFESMGYEFKSHWVGWKMQRTDLPANGEGYKPPICDFMFVKEDTKGFLRHTSTELKREHGNDKFEKSLKDDVERKSFGPIQVQALKEGPAKRLFDSSYGKDWNDVAFLTWDHIRECPRHPEKVTLTDRTHATYTGVKTWNE